MMVPFNKTHLTLSSIIKSFYSRDNETRLKNYFQKYTGKKFVLITNSCRSALYLTYKSLEDKGDIITSPLTCLTGLDPVKAGGFNPIFSDIDPDKLTMSPKSTSGLITNKVKGIQLIHFGGIPCDLKESMLLARKHGLFVVEDCAQGLFSERNGVKAGTVGDYICFSLIKNAKGIGGGILATDDKDVYERASKFQEEFSDTPVRLVLYRIVRNLLENYRTLTFIGYLYNKLMVIRHYGKLETEQKGLQTELKLFKPLKIERKIAYIQLIKAKRLNKVRGQTGARFINKLKNKGIMSNYEDLEGINPSFVKFYLVNGKILSRNLIDQLNQEGIEAMHLEYKYGVFYQERLDRSFKMYEEDIANNCPNYLNLHDKLVALPFFENMSEKKMDTVIDRLLNNLN